MTRRTSISNGTSTRPTVSSPSGREARADEASSPPGTRSRLLTKGIEEEVYTGTYDGDVIGMSNKIAADMPHYSCEPDSRNVEFATLPHRGYADLERELADSRARLRDYLRENGGFTLVPGASLSVGGVGEFHRSNPSNPYHTHIETSYGSDVVTTSAHLNIGIEDPESLLRAYRVIRMESSLFLALTTASPFLNDELTGDHSTRWRIFPRTPANVPLFANHCEYIRWIDQQLELGTMYNIRHLWLSVRPNGTGAPREIQRLELRVCDRIDDLEILLGMTALFEARLWEILTDSSLDPLIDGADPAELRRIADANDLAVAADGFDAEVFDWRSGERVLVRDWAPEYLASATETAAARGFDRWLAPIRDTLDTGPVSECWIERFRGGESIRSILRKEIERFEARDREHASRLFEDDK